MRHYLVVRDAREVLGIWEAEDARAASRLKLQLSLSYPGCTTIEERAPDFESFKALRPGEDLHGLEPEPFAAV